MSELNKAIDVLVNTLVDSGAENYNQHIVSGDNGVDYVVTVQVKDGLTPCEKLAAMEQKSEWVSVDKWEKVDCETVWVFYSHITSLGMFTGSDKAYWNKDMNCWCGFGIDNVFSNGAQVRYVQSLPTPPKGE